MKYLVLECHPGYAVVLDKNGRFLKVANLNYEVGQTVERVVEIAESTTEYSTRIKRVSRLLTAAAACLCLIFGGANYYWFTPQGTIRMAINPEVKMIVNRLDYVLKLEGVNEEGVALVQNISRFGKKVDTLADELADKAFEKGFLSEGGQIALTVLGENEQWKKATEERLKNELESHFDGKVIIVTEPFEQNRSQKDLSNPSDTSVIIPIQPVPAAEGSRKEIHNGSSGYSDTDYGVDTDYGPRNHGETKNDNEVRGDDIDGGPEDDGMTDYGGADDLNRDEELSEDHDYDD